EVDGRGCRPLLAGAESQDKTTETRQLADASACDRCSACGGRRARDRDHLGRTARGERAQPGLLHEDGGDVRTEWWWCRERAHREPRPRCCGVGDARPV